MNKQPDRARDLAAIATDSDAFEAFYREHLSTVRVYLARRVNDPYDAADLTAEVFLRTIRGADTYRWTSDRRVPGSSGSPAMSSPTTGELALASMPQSLD